MVRRELQLMRREDGRSGRAMSDDFAQLEAIAAAASKAKHVARSTASIAIVMMDTRPAFPATHKSPQYPELAVALNRLYAW